MSSFGLIAGNGSFPIEVARAAISQGYQILAVAHEGETTQELSQLVDEIVWVKVGQLNKIIESFKRAHVSEAAMAGGIRRARLRELFQPDERALRMLARIGRFSDDAVLRGVAEELEGEGIAVIDPVERFAMPRAKSGQIAGPPPDAQRLKDLELAFQIAHALGHYDVGQTVAVRDGIVAAVEAAEGTDSALRRGASLVGPGLVVAKARKISQDLRFDRPAIGPATVELMREIKAGLLGLETNCTLILEFERTCALAEKYGIPLYGYG